MSEKEVLEVIQKALNLKGKTLTGESTMQDVKEWDSLGHLSILSALDKAFGGKIAAIKKMATVDSVRKILQLLRENSLI